MLTQEEKDRLFELNPEALVADGFEEAYIGFCQRFGQEALAAYDYEKCIGVLMKRDGMTYEEACEFFDFNVIGAWVGDGTPVFIWGIEYATSEGSAAGNDSSLDGQVACGASAEVP